MKNNQLYLYLRRDLVALRKRDHEIKKLIKYKRSRERKLENLREEISDAGSRTIDFPAIRGVENLPASQSLPR